MSAVAHIDEYKTGRFYTDEYRGSSSWNGYETNVLLRNEGCGDDGIPHFTDVAMAVGVDDVQDSRGFAVADFDRDGDLDLAVNHNPGDAGRPELGQARLYLNQLDGRRPWIAVELVGVDDNRDAIGAVVTVHAGDLVQVRRLSAGSGYASQDGRRLYFGLGEQDAVDRIEVRWPNGFIETVDQDLDVGSVVEIEQGLGARSFALEPREALASEPG